MRACIFGADKPAGGGMGGGGGGGSGRPGVIVWRGVGETPGVTVGEDEGRDMVFASGCELTPAAAWRGCIWIGGGKGKPFVPTVSSSVIRVSRSGMFISQDGERNKSKGNEMRRRTRNRFRLFRLGSATGRGAARSPLDAVRSSYQKGTRCQDECISCAKGRHPEANSKRTCSVGI